MYSLGCLMFEITTGGQAPWALELQAEPMLNEHDAFIDMLLRVPSPRPTLLGEKSGQNARLLCITAATLTFYTTSWCR